MRRKSYLRVITITLTLLHTAGENLSSKNDSLEQTSLEEVTKPSEIETENPPKFKNFNKLLNTINIPSGSSLRLKCPATGNPLPNITWTCDGVNIERVLGKVNYKQWSMQLDDISSHDSGLYKCLVFNKHGCIEHFIYVAVMDRFPFPIYMSENYLQNQTVFTNSNAKLQCRVVSDLESYIYWIKDMQKNVSVEQLESMTSNNVIDQKSKDIVILAGDPVNPKILKFTNVSHKDEGWYTCVVNNSLGTTTASAYMRVVDKRHSTWIIITAIVVVVLILVGTIYIVYIWRNLKYPECEQHFETVYQWTKKVIIIAPPSDDNSSILQIPVIKIEKQCMPHNSPSNKSPTIDYSEYDFPVDTNWEICRSQLSLGYTLGEGCFGRVVMARASALLGGTATTLVAVKMVKDDYTDADVISLMHEMELMKIIGKHVNIINLLSCCSQNGPLWVIVEFARYGNLKDFLKYNRPLDLKKTTDLTEKHLISFALQIGQGMEYLASRRCIHRDLAARNVLVSDDFIMKIADFGLARDIHDKNYYRKNTNGRLPIKWMAPESMQEQFYNSQTDVWSYGVLLWEIMTFGEQPYANIMSAEELYSYLISGKRMAMPTGCSRNIYMLMRQCWHIHANARPIFTEIVDCLKKINQLSSIITRYANLPNPEYKISLAASEEEFISQT